MSLRPDDTLGTYRVVRRLGSGGTAEVYEVEHVVLHTRHALKILLAQWVEHEEIRARFLQEGRMQAEFRHPGLVRVTDTVAEPGVAGLVMDLLEGESVRSRLEREGHIAPKEAVEWMIAVLDALGEAHAKGIIHRDLKPENLFLEKMGPAAERIKIIDFGIAKGPGGQRTTPGGTLGTVAYMSPEQVKDPASVDVRTDLFALGAVLWELLVGRPAFEGKSAFESMERVLQHDPGPPGEKRQGVPGWLDDIVVASLRKDPTGRFPTAAAFADALRAGAKGAELPAAPKPVPGAKPIRRAPSEDGTGAFALTVLGLLGGSLVLGVAAILLVAGLGVYFRPPEIHSVYVSSDACGLTTIEVDARARSGNVEIIVDSGPAQILPITGRQTLRHTVQLQPGANAFVEVQLATAYDSQNHFVNGVPTGVSLQLPSSRIDGAVGRTLVRVDGTCQPPGLTYEARVDGAIQSGPVPANHEIWLDTTKLGEGPHAIEAQVLATDGSTLDVETATLHVGPKPPPGDLDQDGHASISAGGRDCDDSNPRVNPDMDESSSPNGIDDNCDGRIDEGTVVYDDDGDGLSEQQGDCNDNDRRVRPGAPELPDCRDQDCDGDIDEGVTLAQREDTYEPNDSMQTAFDLKTSQQRAFTTDLSLVSAGAGDEAWFRFYSQDGDFDDWGIDVTALELPTGSAYTFEVLDANGASRGTRRVLTEGEELQIRGRWLRDDGGDYFLRVRPEKVVKDWCPMKINVTSR
ncbi:MAG: protein kinase [Alphaproteobacteria bacterium]|nr:protein kinase [Alphaproteobacteria bacterium]